MQIGKIVEIQQFGPKPDDIKINVVWYYRPEEALGGRKAFHGEKELFDSDHPDEIHKNTIIGKCFVHTLRKYESLATIKDQDFFTRFFYRPGKKEFEPDQVPVYCDCEQPYNPDKPMVMCEECEDWFHPECIGISALALQQADKHHFCCPSCKEKASNKRLKLA
eukprot:365535-Chlamydomonas_euryale.AAC.58